MVLKKIYGFTLKLSLITFFRNQSLSNEVREFAISISNTVKSSLNVPKTKGKPTVKNTQAGEQSQAQGKRNQSFAKGKAVELYIPLCIFKVRKKMRKL